MHYHALSNIFLKLDNLISVSEWCFVPQVVNQFLDGLFSGSLGGRHINNHRERADWFKCLKQLSTQEQELSSSAGSKTKHRMQAEGKEH